MRSPCTITAVTSSQSQHIDWNQTGSDVMLRITLISHSIISHIDAISRPIDGRHVYIHLDYLLTLCFIS